MDSGQIEGIGQIITELICRFLSIMIDYICILMYSLDIQKKHFKFYGENQCQKQ